MAIEIIEIVSFPIKKVIVHSYGKLPGSKNSSPRTIAAPKCLAQILGANRRQIGDTKSNNQMVGLEKSVLAIPC